MDPISIISLISTCASLATKVVTTAGQIDDFLKNYRGADQSVASLATTLRLFGESLTQMRLWLEREPEVSQNLRRTIRGSVDDCEVVLGDLEEHVASVLRSANRATMANPFVVGGGLGFRRKLKHLWNANTIAKQEARLNSLVQTIMHLINFVKLNNTGQQDSAVDTAETRTIIGRSAREANLIRSLREGSTIRGSHSISGSSTAAYTNVGDDGKELEIDEVLFRSPAYIAQYRALMRAEPSPGSSSSNSSSKNNKPSSPASDKGSSRLTPVRLSFKSLTWSRSLESRKLVEDLCQAAIAGNVKWIERLLDQGAYVNGWIMDEDKLKTFLGTSSPNSNPLSTTVSGRQTPLMFAVMHKRHDAFHLLLDRGADLKAKDSAGRGVWNYLYEVDPEFCVELIISGDMIPPPELLPPLLFEAFELGDLERVKLVIARGAKVDGTLQCAKVGGWPGLGDAWIEFLARTSNPGPTPLFSVVGHEMSLDMVRYLVSKGANIRARTGCKVKVRIEWPDRHDVTPLHVACGAAARLLISKGADVFAVDSEGQTPLFWAIGLWCGPDLEAVLVNLAQGAAPDLVDNNGLRPLLMLIKSFAAFTWVSEKTMDIFIATAKALLDAGAIPLDTKRVLGQPVGSSEYQARQLLLAHRAMISEDWRTAWAGYVTDAVESRAVEALYLGPRYHYNVVQSYFDHANVQVRDHDGTMISGPVAVHHEMEPSLARQIDVIRSKVSMLFDLLFTEEAGSVD